MEIDAKINTDSENELEFINRDEVQAEFGEAVASTVSADQSGTWAKFVLTDDRPNGNKQRVPLDEFDNIIRTGLFKPIKMAMGEIKDGHDDAHPLGTITHLTKEGNKIIALAALWDKERPDDVALIKERVNNNLPVNVSWEILYGKASLNKGVSDLLDTVLRAVTIVGMPAYAGRTQFVAIAAKKWTPDYINGLPNEHFLYVDRSGQRHFAYRDDTGKIDPTRFSDIETELSESQLPENTLKGLRRQVRKLNSVFEADAGLKELLEGEAEINLEDSKLENELQAKITELESKLAVATSQLGEKETALVDAQGKLIEIENTVKTLTDEIQPLRDFKQASDEAAEKIEKLNSIKQKFVDSKLEKSDEYFAEKADMLLGLDDAGLDFLLQEMVAFTKTEEGGEVQSSLNKGSIPNLSGVRSGVEVKDIVAALRERNKK